MPEFQIKNPAHREYMQENGSFDLADSLGLVYCGPCEQFGILTLMDTNTRTFHFHRFGTMTACKTVPVCDACNQEKVARKVRSECLDMAVDDHCCRDCIRGCTDPECREMVAAAVK